MFGQEPRLPIDFLLGRVQEPVAGGIHHWVEEHQARLHVAFEGARERLQVAAQYRKAKHDQRVREQPLTEGHMVYLREHGFLGRHKIQDLWSSTVYQVVRVPRDGGAVYTVAPVQDLAKVRNVHRMSLKPRIPGNPALTESLELAQGQHELPAPPVVEEELEDGDLAYVVVETLPVGTSGVPLEVMVSPTSDRGSAMVSESGASSQLESGSVILGPSGGASRRTRRIGAGQHSNLHHLPRAVGGGANQILAISTLESDPVAAWFRPWDQYCSSSSGLR